VKDVLKRGVLEPGTVRLCTECSFVGVVSRRKEVCVCFGMVPKHKESKTLYFWSDMVDGSLIAGISSKV